MFWYKVRRAEMLNVFNLVNMKVNKTNMQHFVLSVYVSSCAWNDKSNDIKWSLLFVYVTGHVEKITNNIAIIQFFNVQEKLSHVEFKSTWFHALRFTNINI